ncbi:MAG: hypothetical protein HY511_08845, partial [Actinobacteria bacterium]|nr:hypothetical protein [Actinomycetota bacterium]
VLYPVAVHYKGKGFYSTDYGRARKGSPSRDGDSASAPTSSDSAKPASSKDSGGAEKKAAASD